MTDPFARSQPPDGDPSRLGFCTTPAGRLGRRCTAVVSEMPTDERRGLRRMGRHRLEMETGICVIAPDRPGYGRVGVLACGNGCRLVLCSPSFVGISAARRDRKSPTGADFP